MRKLRYQQRYAAQALVSLSILVGTDMAAAGQDLAAVTPATIASRSYGSQVAGRIAGRSTPSSAAVRRRPAPVPSLDPVRVERTDRYRLLIEHYSQLNDLDADLVKAVVYTESGGDVRALSPQGAAGLMQLMPGTASDLGVTDPFDAEQNLSSGTRYLRSLLDRFGSDELALWAYNAGPGAVSRGHVPSETQDYIPTVMRVRRAFAARQTSAGRQLGDGTER